MLTPAVSFASKTGTEYGREIKPNVVSSAPDQQLFISYMLYVRQEPGAIRQLSFLLFNFELLCSSTSYVSLEIICSVFNIIYYLQQRIFPD